MVRKHNFDEGLFEWHMFEQNFSSIIQEKVALEDPNPLLVMYRVKPDFKKVPLPPEKEIVIKPPVKDLKPIDTLSTNRESKASTRTKTSRHSRQSKRKKDKRDKSEKKDKKKAKDKKASKEDGAERMKNK